MNRSKPEQLNASNHNVKRIKTLTSVSTPTGPNGADVKQFRVSIRALLPREFDVAFSSELHKIQIVNVLRDNGIPAKIKITCTLVNIKQIHCTNVIISITIIFL